MKGPISSAPPRLRGISKKPAKRVVQIIAFTIIIAFAGRTSGQVVSPLQGGEDISTALVLTGPLPVTANGTTSGHLDDYDEACPFPGSEAPDVVYAFTPASSMIIDIDLCGSSYDTKVFVYENMATPGIPYGCNDDYYFDEPCGLYVSKIEELPLSSGNTYYIIIDGFSGADYGDYTVTLSLCGNSQQCAWGTDILVPPWAVTETEPCGGDVNGGCNMPSGSQQWVAVPGGGATYSGTLWADNGDKDSDWFELAVGAPSSVILTANSDREVLFGMVETTVPGAPTCATTTGQVNPGSLAGPCNESSIDLGVLAPGTYWFTIAMTADDGYPCTNHYLFDIDVNPLPCPVPESLTASGITASSANLGWTETGSASLWEYELGLASFSPQGSGTVTGSNPVSVNGLASHASYDFYVRSVCSENDSSTWAGPFTFSTTCNGPVAIPWSEGFEAPWPPACWSDVVKTDFGWDGNIFGSARSGSGWGCCNLAGSALVTPELYLASDAILSFWYRVEDEQYPQDLEVRIGNDVICELSGVTSTAYHHIVVPVSEYTGQSVNISFIGNTGTGNGDYGLCLDDVAVQYSVKWTGNMSTAWNNPANWQNNSVPGITDAIVIPSAPTGNRFPSIAAGVTAVCNYIFVSPGASLSVKTGGILNLLNQ